MSFVPSTPERKGRKSQPFKSPLNLKTPQTAKKPKDEYRTKTPAKSMNLMPVTPDFTPQRSPRIRRKKPSIDIPYNEFSFLPTPSTVGTGRKPIINSSKSLKASLSMNTLAKLNDGLNFESESDGEDNFFMSSTSSSKDFISGSNLLKSSAIISMDPPSPIKRTTHFEVPKTIKAVPQTPGPQLIDDDKINQWYGKSKAYFSDEDVEDLPPQKSLVNPFLSSSKEIKLPTTSQTDVDYSTHVEFIHNKTGERKVVKLSDRQAKIKPKKLDFSSAV